MFGLSLGHILILLVVLLLFGARRLPELGGSLGKGLRAFKKGLEGGNEDRTHPNQQVGHDQNQGQSQSHGSGIHDVESSTVDSKKSDA